MWALGTRGGYTPIIHITVDGVPIASPFYSRLIKATFRDEAGQTSDSYTFELDDRPPHIAMPRKNALVEAYGGFKETGIVLIGRYKHQTVALKGDADSGETMVMQGSGWDAKTKLKGAGREAFEDTTVGEIVRKIAGRNGLTPRIASEIASIRIPYRARVDNSEIDFLTQLGDEIGAVIKPMGDTLVAARKGEAKAISGQNLPPVIIRKGDCSAWEITPEGRPQYGRVASSYIDQRTGKRVVVDAPTGLKGPIFTLRDPLPNEDLARKAAQAEARRLTRNTGEGSFTLAKARLDTQAEADLTALDFRDGVAGAWRIDAVEKEFSDDGWTEKIEVKAREDGGSSGSDERE